MNMDKAAGDLKSSSNETVYDRRLLIQKVSSDAKRGHEFVKQGIERLKGPNNVKRAIDNCITD